MGLLKAAHKAAQWLVDADEKIAKAIEGDGESFGKGSRAIRFATSFTGVETFKGVSRFIYRGHYTGYASEQEWRDAGNASEVDSMTGVDWR